MGSSGILGTTSLCQKRLENRLRAACQLVTTLLDRVQDKSLPCGLYLGLRALHLDDLPELILLG